MSVRKLWLRAAVITAAATVAMTIVASSGSAGVWRHRSLEQAALAALAKPPATVLPASGRVLGGLTSQQQAIVLYVAKKDKGLNKFVTALQMTCTSGDNLLLPASGLKVPLSKAGTVNVTGTIPPSTGSPISVTGGTVSFSGKLNGKKATFAGKVELKLDFSDSSTGQTDSCDSGAVPFHVVL